MRSRSVGKYCLVVSLVIGTRPESMNSLFEAIQTEGCLVLRLCSADGTNRLTCACVQALTEYLEGLTCAAHPPAIVITGNDKFFSAGADLKEILELNGTAAFEFSAFEFSKMGQRLMQQSAEFPAPVYAAISGYCMGGGLDLALACHRRIAAPHAIFGHRGAALGLLTGWGGTQRLPRLIGKGHALEMFVAATKLNAEQALGMGLVDAIAGDPVAESVRRIRAGHQSLE
jgi:enoyl-CoA hydratase/carnithine racemase